MRLIAYFLTIILTLPQIARAGGPQEPGGGVGELVSDSIGDLLSVEITKNQVADSPQACQSFKLSKVQVAKVFQYARIISEVQKRDEYPHYPCYARGKVVTSKGTFFWEIGGGGSGGFWKNIRSISYFACGNECKEIFIEVGPDGVSSSGGR